MVQLIMVIIKSKSTCDKINCFLWYICYMQQALSEAMGFDINDGNPCDTLLEKVGAEDGKNDNFSPSHHSIAVASGLMNSDRLYAV